MRDMMRVIREDGLVATGEALELFGVLAPITACAPDDPEAVDACRRVIERVPTGGLLPAVLDWWFVVTTGEPSVNGGAHRLPPELGDDLGAAMTALAQLDAGRPSAQWVAASRTLDGLLAELDDHLSLDHYGKSKLPKERDVWADLVEQYAPTVEALRAGRKAEPVKLETRRFGQNLKAADIDEGSRRWREMTKRAGLLTDFLNQTVQAQHAAEPWRVHTEIRPVTEVPPAVKQSLEPLTTILLAPVLADARDPLGDPGELVGALDAAAEASTAAELFWLAEIADSWISVVGRDVPRLSDILVRQSRVRESCRVLQAAGTDTDEIELALLDHDLDLAERLVTTANETNRNQERRDRAQRQLDRLRDLAAGVDIDQDWWAQLQADIERAMRDDDLDATARLIGSAERSIAQARRGQILDEARYRLSDLELLAAPDSVTYDIRARLDDLTQHPEVRLDADLLDQLDAQVHQYRLEREAEAADLLDQIETTLTRDRAELPTDVLAAVELQHATVEADLRDQHYVAAIEAARELLRLIEAQRVHRWTSEEGERPLIDHLVSYTTSDLDFHVDDILRLHAALKTKPFVILAGLTGSGKSSLARLFAEAVGSNTANGRFRRIAVRPDWIDQSEVLGFVNPISQRFEPGWLAETVRNCERSPDHMFFVLLDEMNLAPVEQYLAEMLSAMEEARSGGSDVSLRLYPRGSEPKNASEWSSELRYPENLFVIGTINIDETTRPLSDRVIDRANVLQLSLAVSDRHHQPAGPVGRPWSVPYSEWRAICRTEPSDDHHDFLVSITEILGRAGIGIGIRAHVELERFVANTVGILPAEAALDWGIVQRVLPKVRGFKGPLTDTLTELHEELSSVGAQRASAVVAQWLDPRISDDEFLDGTEARVALAGP